MKKTAERATPRKWRKIEQRAREIALNHGKPAASIGTKEIQQAKRELLGLQTLKNPDKP